MKHVYEGGLTVHQNSEDLTELWNLNGKPLLSLVRPMLNYELRDGDWTDFGRVRITVERLEEEDLIKPEFVEIKEGQTQTFEEVEQ